MNDIPRIYNAYSNILNMLHDRNYKIDKKFKLSKDKFRKKYYDDNYNILVKHTTTTHNLGVYFSLHIKNKLQIIKQFIIDIFENNTTEDFSIILILNNKPNNIILKFINSTLYKDKIEIFWIDILQINITNHILQPTFILLNELERQIVLDKYNIKVTQLPKLSIQDPICKYYKFPKLSVIKIIRKNTNSINTEYFRYVS